MDPKGKMTNIAADTNALPKEVEETIHQNKAVTTDSNSGMRTIDDILQTWEEKCKTFLNNISLPQSKERSETLQNTTNRRYVDRDEPLHKNNSNTFSYYNEEDYPPLNTLTTISANRPKSVRYNNHDSEEIAVTNNSRNSNPPPRSDTNIRSRKGSTKRYYMDKDEPDITKQKICYWHKLGICKFGDDCWHSHDTTFQPFRY